MVLTARGANEDFMKLVILGTAGYHPSEQRHTSCLVLPEMGLVMDAGSAMFRLPKYLQGRSLDIFLSHAHLDHVWGLTFLLDVLYLKPQDRVRVFARNDKLTAIRQHLFSPHIFPVDPPFESIPLAGRVELAQGCCLTTCELQHPGGSVGFRLQWPDRSLAYITDTTSRGASSSYVEFIRGVDLLVHECNFADGREELAELTGHSCTTPVAEVARAAAVGRLVLTHLNPLVTDDDPIGLSVARKIFANTELASDEMQIEF